MEWAFRRQLKKFIMRALLYAAGLLVILALVGAVSFSLLKPRLLRLAQAEMRKYGVEAQNLDMSLFGTVHMRDLVVPLGAGGGALRIDAVAARPPVHFWGVTWLGSSGALYNLRLEKGPMRLTVPELRFSGLALEDKDPSIASHSLQMLQRLRARRLYADTIRLAVNGEAGQNGGGAAKSLRLETVLNGFVISGLGRGKMAAIAYDNIKSGAALPAAAPAATGSAAAAPGEPSAAEARQAQIESGAFSAEDLDLAALYALAKNLAPADKAGAEAKPLPVAARGLIGKIRLSQVNVQAEDENFGALHLAAGELGSSGFALKGPLAPADFIRSLAAQGEEAKKQALLHNIRRLLADIAAVNLAMQNVQVEVKPGKNALAAAAARAALPPEKDKKQQTVSEILDAEQQEEAEEEKPARRPKLHMPADFKLSLAGFALTADDWQQAIPYRFYLKIKDLAYRPGPTERAENDLFSLLQTSEQQDLQLSLLGDIAWEADDSSLNIRRLAFYGRDMGGFELQGKLLDIPAAAFAGKAEAVPMLLDKAAIASLEILLQDSGFIHNLVQWGTEQINISAKELETDLRDIAVKSPPLLFKNSREAQKFSDVFGAFIADSGAIRITMSAPQASGLKLSDILSAQDDLPALLGKLKLTADKTASTVVIE